ncbi:UbiA family prenyltransferase [Nocardioides sp. dk884]|uniref:UbiA family prenyltransferase n=1 Tax=Nocardioides sp. dk884 TaxID=2662361 RepID=UPI001E5C2CD9|nr:UbiA family prenyltransferase [Nocardioides sp. dk884]
MTTIATLLAIAAGKPPGTVVLVGAAVLCGQLGIGWGNDLVDLPRDRATARPDKPLATGEVSVRVARAALSGSLVACLVLSALLGWRAALAHLVCVGLAHAYNLGLKATPWSWLPYAGAFGLLPAVATLAGSVPARPAWWAVLAGAVLGVAAHLLNAVPDLADDASTGVHGLPHRLGARRCRVAATSCSPPRRCWRCSGRELRGAVVGGGARGRGRARRRGTRRRRALAVPRRDGHRPARRRPARRGHRVTPTRGAPPPLALPAPAPVPTRKSSRPCAF